MRSFIPKPNLDNLTIHERKCEFVESIEACMKVTGSVPSLYDAFQKAVVSSMELLIDQAPSARFLEAISGSCGAHTLPLMFSDFALAKPTFDSRQRASLRSIRNCTQKYVSLQASHEEELDAEVSHQVDEFERMTKMFPKQAWKQIDQLIGVRKHADVASKSTAEQIQAHFQSVNGKQRGNGQFPSFKSRLQSNIVKTGKFEMYELEDALHCLQSGRAIGRDGIAAEVLKLPELRGLILQLANEYFSGEVSPWLLQTRLQILPKKGDSRFVENCRGIAIISVFLKLMDRMLLNACLTSSLALFRMVFAVEGELSSKLWHSTSSYLVRNVLESHL